MIKKVAALVVLVVAVGGAGYYLYTQRVAQNTENGHTVTAYGNVDIRQVDLAFRVPGRIAQVRVEEGDTVKKGDLLAQLDPETFTEEVALRQAELKAAQADLARLQKGFRPQEIAVARAVVTQHEAVLANLEQERNRREPLIGKGAVTRESYDKLSAAHTEAQARLQAAREELALKKEGYREEDIAKAQAQVESRQALLQIAQTQLQDSKLFAPSDGTILTRVLEPGAVGRSGQTVLALSIDNPTWVRAYISESQLGKVKPGDSVQVYSDSRPDQPYSGQIGYISPVAEFTPKNVETEDLRTSLVYRFRVIVKNHDGGLRQGMPVTVKIETDSGQIQTAAAHD